MMRLGKRLAIMKALLALPMLLLAAGIATAWPGDWGSYLHVGPARNPDGSYVDYSHSSLPPNSLPPPPSSYSWPTLRQALDQYGWFGRRACQERPVYTPAFAGVPVGPPS